jgi:beta-N-acetylhexosaminidase
MQDQTMSVLESLKLSPFNLSDDNLAWVSSTLASLPIEDRLRQLIVQISIGDDPDAAQGMMEAKLGSLCRMMGGDMETASQATRAALESAAVPPFVTADIEGGGHLSPVFTRVQSPLGLAAANDLALSEASVELLAKEARALGFNWTFTPCIDINHNFNSAIVGTRSYGSNMGTILEQAELHVKVMQRNGIAACAKHWPGEGYDSRDQHLVTTVNPLSFDEWDKTFGKLYRAMIEAGVLTVMSAHIALPSFAEKCGVPEGLERFRPASLSKLLNEELLRGHLGFNGLIISDASQMAGMGDWAARASVVPECIENGCDVFLFSDNLEQDLACLRAGLADGRLTAARVEAAVTRILGLKAALGLHRMSVHERILPLEAAKKIIKSATHLETALKTTSKAVTLVKNIGGILPISPARHRRVTVLSNGTPPFFPGMPRKRLDRFEECLAERGFDVSRYDAANHPSPENTDLLIYVFAAESSLTLSRIFLDWRAEQPSMRQTMTRYWHDIPTIMISFGQPYYLFDAPRVKTYINAYSAIDDAQEAVVNKMLGNEPFEGVSPVDAFCGLAEARY